MTLNQSYVYFVYIQITMNLIIVVVINLHGFRECFIIIDNWCRFANTCMQVYKQCLHWWKLYSWFTYLGNPTNWCCTSKNVSTLLVNDTFIQQQAVAMTYTQVSYVIAIVVVTRGGLELLLTKTKIGDKRRCFRHRSKHIFF